MASRPPFQERRRALRVPVRLKGIVLAGPNRLMTNLTNLSVSGAFMVGVDAPLGAQAILRVDLPDGPLDVPFTVVRKIKNKSGNLGIHFLEPMPENVEERLSRYVRDIERQLVASLRGEKES